MLATLVQAKFGSVGKPIEHYSIIMSWGRNRWGGNGQGKWGNNKWGGNSWGGNMGMMGAMMDPMMGMGPTSCICDHKSNQTSL